MSKDTKKGAQRAEGSAAAPVVKETPAAKETPKAVADTIKADKISVADEAAKAIEAVEKAAKRGYFVAEGKVLTSKKGMVSGGEKVTADNWDDATLEKLVVSGAIVKVK